MQLFRNTCALLFVSLSLLAWSQTVTQPNTPGKARVPVPAPDPSHGLKSFPKHRLPVFVPGSTPERRNAWNSLSDEQKQKVMTLFQQHLNQAAAAIRAKKPTSSTPSQFSVPLDGVRLPFKSLGNDLIIEH
jgi:hypothetical protein